jgi:peroxiredoxin
MAITKDLLDNGDRFPELQLNRAGGGRLSLPDDLAGAFGVVLIFRGAWCPYCNAQLSGFARASETLEELGAKVVALSVDAEQTTLDLIDKRRLNFPIGYGADADKVSAITGAWVNAEPHHLQSTGYLLAPDGTVLIAVYASGPIGRLVADDVIGMIRYIKSSSHE